MQQGLPHRQFLEIGFQQAANDRFHGVPVRVSGKRAATATGDARVAFCAAETFMQRACAIAENCRDNAVAERFQTLHGAEPAPAPRAIASPSLPRPRPAVKI
jgi:hypothetical protein